MPKSWSASSGRLRARRTNRTRFDEQRLSDSRRVTWILEALLALVGGRPATESAERNMGSECSQSAAGCVMDLICGWSWIEWQECLVAPFEGWGWEGQQSL